MVAIFVILTIVAFILLDALVQRSELRRNESSVTLGKSRQSYSDVPVTLKAVPGGIFSDAGHTWISLNQDGTANIGIDDFAGSAVGTIDKLALPKVGQEVHRGDGIFTLHQGERKVTFKAPVDGVIETINTTLANNPSSLKEDPYLQGWMCRLRPRNLAFNLRKLLVAEEAVAWLKSESMRFKEFIMARPFQETALGRVLQDGGEVTYGVLEMMDNETWTQFAKEFLQIDKSEPRVA